MPHAVTLAYTVRAMLIVGGSTCIRVYKESEAKGRGKERRKRKERGGEQKGGKAKRGEWKGKRRKGREGRAGKGREKEGKEEREGEGEGRKGLYSGIAVITDTSSLAAMRGPSVDDH